MFNNMDWITINKTEGRGSAEVKVTAPTYRELVDRMTRLKISTLSKTAYVSITQEKITPIFELSKNHLFFLNDVVEENINITSNIAWTATVSNDWITLSSYNGDGNSVLTISVNENDTAERTGSVEFYNSGVLVGSITITYNLFYVEPTEIDLTNNLTTTINITSNTNWSVETSDWITLSQTEGEGNATLTITADEIYNPSQNRSGYIKFYNGDNLLGEVVVNQIILYVNVDVKNINMTNNLTSTINVSSNANWSVECNSDWVSVYPISGNGDGSITVTANTYNDVDREANIYFYINGEIVNSVRVYQAYIPENCFYIEPYNEDESITISTNISSVTYMSGSYYVEGESIEWNEININTKIVSNKKIYIKDIYYNLRDANSKSPLIINGFCNVGGNIETLLGKMRNDYAAKLFYGYDIVDASNLILPATTLRTYCYGKMFYGCTSLVNTPTLPATTLASDCYMDMFSGCTSLVNAPELPATTLASGCYGYMFKDCTSLVNAPELPATTLAYDCYMDMFSGCTSLVNAPALPATTLAYGCYEYMFEGCTSLTTAPELPATTLEKDCYNQMFRGCTSLTTAPELPATTLAQGCYEHMFGDCTSLVNAPELPATTLAYGCYWGMFGYCTSLVNAPELPATTLAGNCYGFMFAGCTSLVNAPELPATTLENYCYEGMFDVCTSLVNAPELPATILTDGCYKWMFQGCTNLNYIKMLATNNQAAYSLQGWVFDVASEGTFIKHPDMILSIGISGIPIGWEVRDADL